jgi:phosphohistidine phosphatase
VTHQLLLLRHAKSSWDDAGLDDHDRPLASRGRRGAKLVAGHMHEAGIAPDLVLCSSARRTRETLELITPALAEETEVLVEGELYAASEDELLERLRDVPESAGSAMLIGHNPGIEQLALWLARSGEERPTMERKYPTGALATIAFEGAWRELQPGAGHLIAFVKPKDLG